WNDDRKGQPATVSAMRTVTSPPSIATSRTMSSWVTGLRSSGSITFPRAAMTASRVGCIRGEGSALEQPGVDLRNAPLEQRQVAVLGSQAGVDARDPPGEPDAVGEGDELV